MLQADPLSLAQGTPSDQSSELEIASQTYEVFRGEGVGFEELADRSDYRTVRTFAVSKRLGNKRHFDEGDGHACYVAWVRLHASDVQTQRLCPGLMWYFLLPDHGVAIGIRDGTHISWVGSQLAHCTLVPHGIREGDELFSLYMGMYTRHAHTVDRRAAMESALHAAHLERFWRTYIPLEVGDTVWVRYYVRDGSWFRASGSLTEECSDGIYISWGGAGQSDVMRGSVTLLTHDVLHDHVTRAGAVDVVPADMAGPALVGTRVIVWRPTRVQMHAGLVTHYDATLDVHHVIYDDGETSDFPLYWESGAAGFVLE
jgi:hypothetical protein